MYQELSDFSLDAHFLGHGGCDFDANFHWMPGNFDVFADSIKQHCDEVAAELRTAGRVGLGRTVSIEEFIELFLTRGQRLYLHSANPGAPMPKAVTLSTLSPPSYIAADVYAPLEPQHFVSVPRWQGGDPKEAMMNSMTNHWRTEGWRLVWPEFRRAMLDYIPEECWPLPILHDHRQLVIDPYVY